MDFKSMNAMCRWRVEKSGPRPAMLRDVDGEWEQISWDQFYERLCRVGTGLYELGVRSGDRVLICADSSHEWVVCDYGVMGIGAVTVSSFRANSIEQTREIIGEAQPKVVIVQNTEDLQPLFADREKLPSVTHFVLLEPESSGWTEQKGVVGLEALMAMGAEARLEHPERFETLAGEVTSDQVATIVYTSGTTGAPKGVVLTHDNLIHQLLPLQEVIGATEEDSTLLILPLAHIFGRVIEHLNVYTGVQLAFMAQGGDPLKSIAETRPHFLAAPPQFYELLYSGILREVRSGGFASRKLFEWSLGIGRQVGALRQMGGAIPTVLRVRFKAARKLVFDRISEKFGDRLKFFISSSAPLSKEISEFFHAADILVLEAYGLTEATGAVTINRPTHYKFGTVGPVLRGSDLILADDGEILIKGPIVMVEYYKAPADTAAAIDEQGWLHTGDIGEIDEDGFVKITGRKKDIIVTATGHNISPLKIENLLKSSPYILQAVVCGDNRDFLSALLALNQQEVENWAATEGIHWEVWEGLADDERVRHLIAREISMRTRALAGVETIQKFVLLAKPFSQDGGELTPTLKLKRRIIEQKYRGLIEGFYR